MEGIGVVTHVALFSFRLWGLASGVVANSLVDHKPAGEIGGGRRGGARSIGGHEGSHVSDLRECRETPEHRPVLHRFLELIPGLARRLSVASERPLHAGGLR